MNHCFADAEFEQLLAGSSAAGPLQFVRARGLAERWRTCLASLPAQPAGYALSHVDYQHAYFRGASAAYAELDCLIRWQGRDVGVWPLAWVRSEAAQARLSSHLNGQAGVAPPLLAELPAKTAKAAARQWLALLGQLGVHGGLPDLRLSAPPVRGNLPEWQRIALEAGAHSEVCHRTEIDLRPPAEDYHRVLRKSFKALINAAQRHWQITIDDIGDAAAFTAFEALHIEVAGRRTRSAESWAAQFEGIVAGEAFAIYLRDGDGKLVGASLFNASHDEVLYAVGAYDRSLFDKPLAHLSLYTAIDLARRRGARRFILGDRPYPGDQPAPNDKELQIAFFKEGFATELVLVPYLTVTPAALCPAHHP